MQWFFAPIYGKWFPWELTDGNARSGGGGEGNFLVWLTRYVPLCMVSVYGIFTLKESIQLHYLASQDDVTRDDSQRRLLAQHVVAMSEQCCNYLKQYCNNVVTVCFRRCESSRLTSPLNRVAVLMHFALNRVRIEGFQQNSPNPDLDLPPPREVSSPYP